MLQLHGTLCDLKRQFHELQLEDVREDHARQRKLYRAAQKVRDAGIVDAPARITLSVERS